MQEIAELERRITSALARIGRGIEAISAEPTQAAGTGQEERASVANALEEERMVNLQLQERLRVLREKDGAARHLLEGQIAELTRKTEEQAEELGKLHKHLAVMSDQMAALRDSAMAGLVEPHHINRAMMTELETLRAARASEAQELAEIVSVLTPLIEESKADA